MDVLKIDPENAQVLNNLAYIKAEEGVDLDQALGFAQRALRRSPNDPNYTDTLGLIYIRKKLTGQALAIFRENFGPDHPAITDTLQVYAAAEGSDKKNGSKHARTPSNGKGTSGLFPPPRATN